MSFTQADITRLISLLPTSKTNAIHAYDIAQQLGLPTDRNQVEARALIRFAIQNGHYILSNTRVGYWVSNNKTEIQKYINSLRSRASDTLQRSDELRNSWNANNPSNTI